MSRALREGSSISGGTQLVILGRRFSGRGAFIANLGNGRLGMVSGRRIYARSVLSATFDCLLEILGVTNAQLDQDSRKILLALNNADSDPVVTIAQNFTRLWSKKSVKDHVHAASREFEYCMNNRKHTKSAKLAKLSFAPGLLTSLQEISGSIERKEKYSPSRTSCIWADACGEDFCEEF